MGRPPCCDKSNVKRGLWTEEEDAKILAYVANHGIGNWTLVPQKAGLNRCGKSCRLRWTNYLRPDLKNHSFTPQEEQLILDYHQAIGSRWSLIAKQLPGRTDNDVKNYWNTKLKKKLSKMGIDPLTHKPFSQILSDYGKITRNQIGSFNNSITHMSEPSLVSMELSKTTMNQQFQDKSFPNNWDNVAQFHRINQETIQPQLLTEVSSQSRVPVTPSSPSSWNEFLLGDPVLSADMNQKHEHDLQEMLSSACCEAASSSSADSFVEAILDRDMEMQLDFPVLLNEYLSP